MNAEHFKSFEIHVTIVVPVNGTDYFASDFDSEEAFRADITKEALHGMRNANLDIGDAWLDHIEEVTTP